jgi:hypothetical protein
LKRYSPTFSQIPPTGQKGAILVEALIVFTLLMAIFLALFDYFTLSAAYVNLSQAAREGVLTATGMNEFRGVGAATTCTATEQTDLQTNPGPPTYQICQPGGNAATCGHHLVQWRIQQTLVAVNSQRLSPDSISVTTVCSPGGRPEFEVRISAIYQGISPFFKNTPMGVRQMGLIQ